VDHPFDQRIAMRRVVQSRTVKPGDVVIIDSVPPAQSSPILREVISPNSPPAIEPTRLGERRRKRGHERRYRLAQWACILSLLATAAAVGCITLGDLRIALLSATAGSALGIVGVIVSAATRLSSRLLGSAIAVSVLALAVTLCATGLPRGWFEHHADQTLPIGERSSHSQAAGEQN